MAAAILFLLVASGVTVLCCLARAIARVARWIASFRTNIWEPHRGSPADPGHDGPAGTRPRPIRRYRSERSRFQHQRRRLVRSVPRWRD